MAKCGFPPIASERVVRKGDLPAFVLRIGSDDGGLAYGRPSDRISERLLPWRAPVRGAAKTFPHVPVRLSMPRHAVGKVPRSKGHGRKLQHITTPALCGWAERIRVLRPLNSGTAAIAFDLRASLVVNNSGSEDLWLSATGAVVNGGRWPRGLETSPGAFCSEFGASTCKRIFRRLTKPGRWRKEQDPG
jgi:hypothetical protein